jgi:septal ring factor EnvC (AmiA/AmiB activator)
MIKKITFCFLLCFLMKYVNAEALLDTDSGTIRSRIEASEQTLQQLSQHKEDLNELLAEIEKRYGETAAILKKLHAEIEHANQSLSKIRSEMGLLNNEIKKENKELSGQIRSAYVMGQKEKLKLLLNQQDAGLSGRMMIYYNYLNKARVTKLTEINKAVKKLDQLEKDKQQESVFLEKKLDQKKSEQVILDAARNQRHELLAQINDNLSSDSEQLSQVIEGENKLRSVIAGLQNSEDGSFAEPAQDFSTGAESATDQTSDESSTNSMDYNEEFPQLKVAFSTLKGKLPWPVRGRVTQKFGSPRSDSVWDGVLIDAKEGTDIHSVTWGKVVYAEWLRGYGLLTIIDHGQGYMTLYAFNQSVYKHVGDTINAGDIIASVGQSGGRSQSGLYFGIRKKGLPIDPLEWCRK